MRGSRATVDSPKLDKSNTIIVYNKFIYLTVTRFEREARVERTPVADLFIKEDIFYKDRGERRPVALCLRCVQVRFRTMV